MIDLHIHSTFSDGTLTPTEIVELAAEKKLKTIALTDHDNISGLAEFQEAAKKYPEINCINGIEFSSLYGNKELHFVGLFIDETNPKLLKFLEELQNNRLARNILIAKKLFTLGYDIDREILPYHKDKNIGRPHFANYLVKYYGFENMQDVFDKFLRRGRSAFVERSLPMPSDVINIIHEANGLAIWAHPIFFQRSHERSFLRRIVKKLSAYGLDGFECYYSMFNNNDTSALLEISETYDMLASGGSDFHGDNRPNIDLGSGGGYMNIPDDLYEKMLLKLAEKGN